jgi:EmrB/QacA subfamily drug resistance transporter
VARSGSASSPRVGGDHGGDHGEGHTDDYDLERLPTPRAADRAERATGPEPEPHPRHPPLESTQTTNWGLPLAVVVVGMFMSVLDTSIVNVAIPTMEKQFSVTSDDIEWVSTAYTLCLGVIVPTSAWLGDRMGLRRLYLISLLGFAFFSAMCGTAENLGVMVVYRILQAVPAGVLPVTCLTILYRMVPRDKLGAAMGLYGFGLVIAPGVGPALGGYLVEYVDWRLIFYINVPIGVLGAVAAVMILPSFPPAPSRKFDLPGFVCIAGGLFAGLLAVSEGPQWGWTSYSVLVLAVVSVNLILLFVAVENWVEHPLLDVRVFRSLPFINSLVLITIMTMGMFSVLYYVPQFLQVDQDITPLNTGLVVLPQAAVMAVIMPYAGRIYDRFGARWPAVIGLLLNTYGSYLMIDINVDATRPEIIAWTSIRAAGLAMCMMPIMTAGLSSLPSEISNFGSAYNTMFQRVSSALGVSVMTALTTSQQAQFMANRSGLIQPGAANTDARILQMQQQGPEGLLPLWRQLTAEVLARSYSNVFLVITILTALGIPLAFLLRAGRPEYGDGERAEPIEM